jgi:hypothetical protein
MQTYLVRSKAIRALGNALATFDPDYQPGDPLDPDVLLVGQALGLLPYDSLVDTNGGFTRNEKRQKRIWRRPVLVESADQLPDTAIKSGKFA